MDLKKLLYKMLVKYYLIDNIKVLFEDFALSLRNAQAGFEKVLGQHERGKESYS